MNQYTGRIHQSERECYENLSKKIPGDISYTLGPTLDDSMTPRAKTCFAAGTLIDNQASHIAELQTEIDALKQENETLKKNNKDYETLKAAMKIVRAMGVGDTPE